MMDDFFDGNDVDEQVLNGPMIPDGEYRVVLAQAIKEDSRRDPRIKMYVCNFSIVEGPLKGHNFKNRFIYEHPTSPMAVDLGRARFKVLCKVLCGGALVKSSADIENKFCYVVLKNTVSKGGFTSIDIKEASEKPIGSEKSPTIDDLPF